MPVVTKAITPERFQSARDSIAAIEDRDPIRAARAKVWLADAERTGSTLIAAMALCNVHTITQAAEHAALADSDPDTVPRSLRAL